jgi:D-alanyl-D-alanine carboxypeptidase/D-alanyl-D-alanine-endopeptidase (penicillin-binding protein 4)
VRRGLLALVTGLVLALSPQAAGGSLPLATRLANALAVGGNATSSSSAIAIDLRSGATVFARHADVALAPASNEKLAVTFAALKELGVDYRFRTDALATGAQQGTVLHGDLFLKGFGDPTLTSARLERLAVQVAALGITRVEGRVLADESWFDARRTAPGWKAGFLVNECPPLSALVVDRAEYDHHVALDPALAAAGTFRRLLRKHGVTTGAAGHGRAPAAATPLAEVQSATLRNVLQAMDGESDNFRAEMIMKELGAEAGDAGTTAAGALVVRRDLAVANVPLTGVVIADGSGLSLLDRLTASALAALLEAAWNDPVLKLPFWAALPVAGETGTLEDRMRTPPARGAVRAKTGTTDIASALSGYVRDRFVFAVLQNGAPVATWPARKAQDRFAAALAAASASD